MTQKYKNRHKDGRFVVKNLKKTINFTACVYVENKGLKLCRLHSLERTAKVAVATKKSKRG